MKDIYRMFTLRLKELWNEFKPLAFFVVLPFWLAWFVLETIIILIKK